MTIYQKINLVKKELSTMEIPKSGHNKHLGFKYHELADFLDALTNLNEKHGVHESITVTHELATMTLTNVETPTEQVLITIPYVMADMQPKNDSIQKLGATLTYLRRYLYLQAYSITEHDTVDSQDLKEQPKVKMSEETAKMTSWLKSQVKDENDMDAVLQFALSHHKLESLDNLDYNKVKKVDFINTLKKGIKSLEEKQSDDKEAERLFG